jgi:hypothetical protein
MILRFLGGLAGAATLLAQCTPSFSLSPEWQISSLPGHTAGAVSYWTTAVGATADWRPAYSGPVRARVSFYKVVHTSGNDAQTILEVVAGETKREITVDASVGGSGWTDLGVFAFAGTCEERIRLTKRTPAVNTRAAALRLDALGESGEVLGSLLLDDVTSSSVGGGLVQWTDLEGNPFRPAFERLGYRGLLEGASDDQFAPAEPIRQGEFAIWLLRATGRMPLQVGRANRRATTAEERAAAAAMARQAGLLEEEAPERALDRRELMRMALRGIEATGRNLEWIHRLPREADVVEPAEYLTSLGLLDVEFFAGEDATRFHAALLLRRFIDAFFDAGPPRESQWKLTFHDDFNGDTLDRLAWSVDSSSPAHIQSSRWPENVEVKEGVLSLLTKREQRGGKEWTTGHIWTRQFRQLYGYFEARLRIGKASGLNNAFWLFTTNPAVHEIDITESHFPRRNNYTIHNYGANPRTAVGRFWISPFDMSDDFQVFGAEWDAAGVTFYVNGARVGRTLCAFCTVPADVRLSTAVIPWAGTITEALDGTRMDVEWVRVYRRVDR